MKQIKVFATLLLLAVSTTSFGQSLKEKENYHKVFVEYSPMSIKSNVSDDKSNFNGIGLGYNYNIAMKDLPLHFGAGLKLDYYFRNNTNNTDAQNSIKTSDNVLTAVPAINCGVDIYPTEKIMISPYVAVGMRIGIFGKEKVTPTVGAESDLNLFNKEDMDPNNVWNRTVSTWEVGVNVTYESYFLGFSYNRDFEKISVNMKQVQAFGIKAGYIF